MELTGGILGSRAVHFDGGVSPLLRALLCVAIHGSITFLESSGSSLNGRTPEFAMIHVFGQLENMEILQINTMELVGVLYLGGLQLKGGGHVTHNP